MSGRPNPIARWAIPRFASRGGGWRLAGLAFPILILLPALLAGMWLLLHPSDEDMLGIALESGELAAAPQLDAAIVAEGSGYVAMQAEALIGQGDYGRALQWLRAAHSHWPGDAALARLEITALAQLGHRAEALAKAEELAHRTRDADDLRTVVALAGTLGQPDAQLPALLLLVGTGEALEWERAAAQDLQAAQQQGVLAPAAAILPPAMPAAASATPQPGITMAQVRAGLVRQIPSDQARELVRTAFNAGNFGDIALIDRVAGTGWREQEPWMAMQVARRQRDWPAARRYAARLPEADRPSAEALIARESGDVAGQRRHLLAEAGRAGADRAAIGRQLIELGDKPGGLAQMRLAAARAAPDAQIIRDMLYFAGPRADAATLTWLLDRAAASTGSTRVAWLRHYGTRERSDTALGLLARQSDAATTPLLMLRLEIARAANDPSAAGLFGQLLDGRPLTPAQLASMRALVPANATSAQLVNFARLQEGHGSATPAQHLDLAYADFRARRFGPAREHAEAYLALRPQDASGLVLAGDIARAMGDNASARSRWMAAMNVLERGGNPQDLLQRAEVLERLGDLQGALALVRQRPANAMNEASLRAAEARLLIALGRPAEAARLLDQPR